MGNAEIIRTIFEEFPYALYGSILVGTICAFLGVYVVAKRVVFFGAVLTQVSVLGLAVTFLPFVPISHTVGSLVITLFAVIIISRLLTGKYVPRDAVLGFVFISSIAARIMIIQKAPKVEVSEIENLLRGDILFVTPEVFYIMLGTFIIVMAAHLAFFKEFRFISFDAETARTQGFNASLWETIFYLITGAVVAFATHMVGDVFVFGFLVAPPIAAMLLTRNVTRIFVFAVLIGIFSPIIGLFVAFKFDFPTSPVIVGVASIIVGVSWIVNVARRR